MILVMFLPVQSAFGQQAAAFVGLVWGLGPWKGVWSPELDPLMLPLHLQVMEQQRLFVGSLGAQEMGSLWNQRILQVGRVL